MKPYSVLQFLDLKDASEIDHKKDSRADPGLREDVVNFKVIIGDARRNGWVTWPNVPNPRLIQLGFIVGTMSAAEFELLMVVPEVDAIHLVYSDGCVVWTATGELSVKVPTQRRLANLFDAGERCILTIDRVMGYGDYSQDYRLTSDLVERFLNPIEGSA